MRGRKFKVEQAFFALVRAGLWENIMVNGEGFKVNGSPLTISDGVDWNEVLDLAEEQSVVGLLAAGIEHVVDGKPQKKDVLLTVYGSFAVSCLCRSGGGGSGKHRTNMTLSLECIVHIKNWRIREFSF